MSLVVFVIEPALEELSEAEFREESALEHRVLYSQLAQEPFARWQSSITAYSSFFELTPSLIEASALPASAEPFTVPDGQTGYYRADEDNMFYSYFPSPLPDWLILYEEGDSELVDESHAEFVVLLLFAGPMVVIILSMLLGIGYLLYAFGRPMRALEKAIEGFSQDTRVRLAPEHGKLIPNIVMAFNGMARRLDTTLTEQQVMIAAIPHELRTPIARIRFALDMLRGREGEKLLQGLERLDNYVDELQQTSEQILELSRVNQEALHMQTVSLNQLVEQSADNYDVAPVTFDLPEEDLQVQGNSALLKRVLENLLDNAVQYHHSFITVNLSRHEGQAVLCIGNDGAELRESDVNQLFQPFYRADSSRSRHSGGLGIGLTLVAQIVTRHRGEVFAELIRPGVLQIRIELPVNHGAS